jgi:hypothetical protein
VTVEEPSLNRCVGKTEKEQLFASSCVSIRLSVHLEIIGTHWTDFQEISYLGIFQKFAEKIQVSLKSENKTSPLYGDTYI